MEPMQSLVGYEPTIENVAGNYRLQSLVTIIGGVWTDWRAAGATLTISLAPNGTTSGQLFIPGSDDGGGDCSADMAGTWALRGETVTLTQSADSFVRNVAFHASENRLSGELRSGHGRVIAVLKK